MDSRPQVVHLPEGVTAEEAFAAITVCVRLGVVEDTGRGWLMMPPGVSLHLRYKSDGSVLPMSSLIER